MVILHGKYYILALSFLTPTYLNFINTTYFHFHVSLYIVLPFYLYEDKHDANLLVSVVLTPFILYDLLF